MRDSEENSGAGGTSKPPGLGSRWRQVSCFTSPSAQRIIMAFRSLHWATEMQHLIGILGYEGEALTGQGMDGNLQGEKKKTKTKAKPMSWSSLTFSMNEKAEDRHPKHDSTAKLTTDLGKRNAQALKALGNPLALPLLLYEGRRLPLMPHLCCILA